MTWAYEYILKLLGGRSLFEKCRQTLTMKNHPVNLACTIEVILQTKRDWEQLQPHCSPSPKNVLKDQQFRERSQVGRMVIQCTRSRSQQILAQFHLIILVIIFQVLSFLHQWQAQKLPQLPTSCLYLAASVIHSHHLLWILQNIWS